MIPGFYPQQNSLEGRLARHLATGKICGRVRPQTPSGVACLLPETIQLTFIFIFRRRENMEQTYESDGAPRRAAE